MLPRDQHPSLAADIAGPFANPHPVTAPKPWANEPACREERALSLPLVCVCPPVLCFPLGVTFWANSEHLPRILSSRQKLKELLVQTGKKMDAWFREVQNSICISAQAHCYQAPLAFGEVRNSSQLPGTTLAEGCAGLCFAPDTSECLSVQKAQDVPNIAFLKAKPLKSMVAAGPSRTPADQPRVFSEAAECSVSRNYRLQNWTENSLSDPGVCL